MLCLFAKKNTTQVMNKMNFTLELQNEEINTKEIIAVKDAT